MTDYDEIIRGCNQAATEFEASVAAYAQQLTEFVLPLCDGEREVNDETI